MEQKERLRDRRLALRSPFAGIAPLLILSILFSAACSVSPSRARFPAQLEGRAIQTGIASWYGPGFHGQLTASGVIYNQNDLTAAHQTLPLGTRVMVTNLNNGHSIEVLINDRGPFAKGRIIDLSHAAAQAIGMIAPGTASVRVEVIANGRDKIQPIRESLDYTLQLGSFSKLENARQLRDRLSQSFGDVFVVPLQLAETTYYRVQIGTFSNRAAAEQQAREVGQLGLPVIIMEK
jgi:rare lipoprotein A